MNKRLIIFIICILISISIMACSNNESIEDETGINIINNSSLELKSMHTNYNNQESGVVKADNSPIEKGEKFFFDIYDEGSLDLYVWVEDWNGKEYKSDIFKLDVNKGNEYNVTIVDDVNNTINFELKEE